MTIGWISRKLNDYAKIPYKTALWVKNGYVIKTSHFKINEEIENTLGGYIESDEPTYRKGHIEFYIYDIKNALQMRLENEAKERVERKKKYDAIPQWYRRSYERLKDISRILGNKVVYDKTIQDDEKTNMKLTIKYISPSEYRAIKELKSFEKVVKTDKPKNALAENKNVILLLIVGAIAIYVIGHFVLHMF